MAGMFALADVSGRRQGVDRVIGSVCGLKRPAFINGRGGAAGRGGTDLRNQRGRLCGCSLVGVLLIHLMCGGPVARGAGDDPAWNMDKAIGYLDGRQTWWMESGVAKRAMGTTCVACHTGLPYALARPALGGDTKRYEAMLENVRKRVENWDQVGPLYTSKADGSRGTEAILNALVLATADARRGGRQTSPSSSTAKAFENLWAIQRTEGTGKGSWPWLEFGKSGFEPWEASDAEYFGAALAALAIETAPGGAAAAPPDRLTWLRDYLAANYDGQNLHARIVLLWASTKVDGLLTAPKRKRLIDEIFALQQDRPGDASVDGGWNIASLGPWVRKDGTAQVKSPDGYATGLIVSTLRRAGVSPEDQPKLRKGLAWLRQNQEPTTGAWPGNSVHKTRDRETDEAWKFPRDAATAFAALALNGAE
jgi:squalene-hopene/tetraprenyl-beta-curcumene cyclase